jgi:hypothetical protein
MEYDDVPLERSGAVKRFCDARADLQASQKLLDPPSWIEGPLL